MDGFDFIGFIAVILLVTMAVISVCMAVSISPATYDGPGQPGDSGLVVAGSGNEPAEATDPETSEDGQEVDSTNADQWGITSETTEETTAVDSEQDGLTIRIVLENGGTAGVMWLEVLCAVCLLIIGTIAVGVWILVRKDFGHG